MADLFAPVTVDGSTLVPDFTKGFDNIFKGLEEREKINRQNQAGALAGQILSDKDKAGRNEKLKRLLQVDPNLAKFVFEAIQRGDKVLLEQLQKKTDDSARISTLILNQPDMISKKRSLNQLIAERNVTGEDSSGLQKLFDITNEDELNLKLRQNILKAVDAGDLAKDFLGISSSSKSGRFTKAPGIVVRLPDGSVAQAIPVLNEQTGEIENRIVPIEGEPVSRLGETASGQTARQIQESRGVKGAQLSEQFAAQAGIAGEGVRGAKVAERQQLLINNAVDSAESLAIVKRSIDLLSTVKTGGIAAAQLFAKQKFGIESANEAELSAALGKAVLSQLRTTFGAAFTENEGARLATIEAGFSKSTVGNLRLLRQLDRMIRLKADRGIKAAVATEDFDAAADIKRLLKFELTDPGQAGTTQAPPSVAATGAEPTAQPVEAQPEQEISIEESEFSF